MFSGWQTFYQLTGGAAAQLIGLLFIVATLNSRQDQDKASQDKVNLGVKLFTTPTVFHLTLVLLVSALALAPGIEIYSASLVMAFSALIGCGYAIVVAVRLRGLRDVPHWSDLWFYGAAPAAVHLALAASAVAACRRVPHAAYAVGVMLLVLLLVAIRNAWDLVTWLAARRAS